MRVLPLRIAIPTRQWTGAVALAEDKDALLQNLSSNDCAIGAVDEYGARYVVDFTYARGDREALIRSTWIIKTGETTPCLTSCFVL